jgi:hypothetical protein
MTNSRTSHKDGTLLNVSYSVDATIIYFFYLKHNLHKISPNHGCWRVVARQIFSTLYITHFFSSFTCGNETSHSSTHPCSRFIDGEIYSIQHYVIKLFSDLRQDGDFLRILRVHPQIKLPTTI